MALTAPSWTLLSKAKLMLLPSAATVVGVAKVVPVSPSWTCMLTPMSPGLAVGSKVLLRAWRSAAIWGAVRALMMPWLLMASAKMFPPTPCTAAAAACNSTRLASMVAAAPFSTRAGSKIPSGAVTSASTWRSADWGLLKSVRSTWLAATMDTRPSEALRVPWLMTRAPISIRFPPTASRLPSLTTLFKVSPSVKRPCAPGSPVLSLVNSESVMFRVEASKLPTETEEPAPNMMPLGLSRRMLPAVCPL